MQALHRDLAMNLDRGARANPSQISNLPTSADQIDPASNARTHHRRTNPQAGTNNNNANATHISYVDALKRCRHDRHDSNWWRRHCRTIVFVNAGYYYLDAGYWYPAYGYDAAYTYSDYDGPIYTYGNLLPDQVIANVQLALRDVGYYLGPVTGSLGPATRAALANFQRDNGLDITGAVDEWTVQSLGLI
jgi:N-acetylmuramoyl-L-alanine amidase